MKTKILVVSAFLLTTVLHAQNKADPQTISSAGSHFFQHGIHLDYTMGEFMVQTLGTNTRFTQGFHQPGLEFVNVIDPAFTKKVRMYPNPVQEFLTIWIDDDAAFEIAIYDVQSKLIIRQSLIAHATLSTGKLLPGTYVISISRDGQAVFADLFEKIK